MFLLCSAKDVSSPVASSSPCPFPMLAVSPVFFQSPNFDLGQKLSCCDFSFTKSLIPTFPFSSFCSSKNTHSHSFPVSEPPKKQMAAGKDVSYNAFERAGSHSRNHSALVQNSYLMWGLSQKWSDTKALLGFIKLDSQKRYKLLSWCTWTVHLCQSCTCQKDNQEEWEKPVLCRIWEEKIGGKHKHFSFHLYTSDGFRND